MYIKDISHACFLHGDGSATQNEHSGKRARCITYDERAMDASENWPDSSSNSSSSVCEALIDIVF